MATPSPPFGGYGKNLLGQAKDVCPELGRTDSVDDLFLRLQRLVAARWMSSRDTGDGPTAGHASLAGAAIVISGGPQLGGLQRIL